jgi:hypothetical protein
MALRASSHAPWENDKKETHMGTCKHGHFVQAGHKFCGQCGTPVGTVGKRCEACGQPLPADRGAATRGDADRGDADEAFQKARAREGAEDADLDTQVAAGALLPGVADIGPGELLFKATGSTQAREPLSTIDIAKLETYVGNGLSLHQVAAIDPTLALRVHRAVQPVG